MKVIVNNQEINIFGGATVKDALRRYATREGTERPHADQVVITDQWEHEIDFDAPLREGMNITFKKKEI